MAYKNKTLDNLKTGQTIRFIQSGKDTGGEMLEMEASFRAHSKEPPPHYHPYQVEDFTVISGDVMVRINGQVKVFRQGEQFHIPRNTVHSMWNGSEVKAFITWKVRPALETENLFENFTGLANDGKTNENGMPPILQAALLASRYSNVFRPAKPPYYVQKLLFAVLTPFSYLLGYRPTYKKYLD